jgi:NAD(P)-dependent dehydrogenase (short-subunit alcohol dehydrogenase family)
MKLTGKHVIISGANQGFGFAVARKFVLDGAQVTICARDQHLLSKAQHELENLTTPPAKVFAKSTDISKPHEVRDLISYAISEMGSIDVLVANAAVHGTKGPIEEINWDEWSDAIDINLKGTVLQCKNVIPHLKQQRSGKIIILSGGGATKPMPYLSAYAASKAAIVRLAETLALELKEFNIAVNSVAPGALNTRLLDDILAAGPQKVGQQYFDQVTQYKENGGTPMELGASLCAFLASSESDGITGKLISAVWDPWEQFPQYIDELRSSDVYTLKRIVPEDRQLVWELNR